jgi:hypothetical protein
MIKPVSNPKKVILAAVIKKLGITPATLITMLIIILTIMAKGPLDVNNFQLQQSFHL